MYTVTTLKEDLEKLEAEGYGSQEVWLEQEDDYRFRYDLTSYTLAPETDTSRTNGVILWIKRRF